MFKAYTKVDKETANSYITVDEFIEFQTIDFTLTTLIMPNNEQEILLMNATHIIDSYYKYVGSKFDSVQNLEFPRDFEVEAINKDIKRATAQIAYDLYINKEDYLSGGTVKREKFEGMEVEYFNNSSTDEIKGYTYKLIKKYVDYGQILETWRS